MSTNKEIRETLEQDIWDKTLLVYRKKGILPFLDGTFDIAVHDIMGGLVKENDLRRFANLDVEKENG